MAAYGSLAADKVFGNVICSSRNSLGINPQTGEMNMADNVLPRGRNFDHRFFAAAAAVMLFAVLVGFGPTFYLKPFFNNPPVARSIIYVHGFVMAAWVALFVVQVYFVSSKRIKLHQKLGMAGVALAVAVFTVGLMVTVAAARYGPASAPANIPPLQFMIVPFGDMLVFVVLFGAAIYYRKNSPNHKRLMLLTMINFLAPAIARFPGGLTNDYGPLWFFGVPTVLTIALIAIDTWRNGKLNKVFLFAGIFMVAAMWIRLPLSSTPQWLSFAQWLVS
jgi:hypothetical protein